MKNIKTLISTLALGVVLLGSVAYAWSAVWHSPSTWIADGEVIDAKKMGESLQYLYDEVQALKSGSNNTTNTNTEITNNCSTQMHTYGIRADRGLVTVTHRTGISTSQVSNILVSIGGRSLLRSTWIMFSRLPSIPGGFCPGDWFVSSHTSQQVYVSNAGSDNAPYYKTVHDISCAKYVSVCE